MSTYEGIAIVLSAATPFAYAGQFKAGAYAGGLSYLAGRACGSSSRTTYSDLESLLATDTELADGAYIFDKRACGDAAVAAVISGPMNDASLPPLTVSRMFEANRTFASVAEALANPDTTRAISSVSLDIYAAFWRGLGARIGRKVNGSIVWER